MSDDIDLTEAADALEGAGRVYGYAVAHDLRARAEAERAGSGV